MPPSQDDPTQICISSALDQPVVEHTEAQTVRFFQPIVEVAWACATPTVAMCKEEIQHKYATLAHVRWD